MVSPEYGSPSLKLKHQTFSWRKIEEYMESQLCSSFRVKSGAKNTMLGFVETISCIWNLIVYLIEFYTLSIVF